MVKTSVTHLNNGTKITYEAVAGNWTSLAAAGYCYYANDSVTNKPKYGALYSGMLPVPVIFARQDGVCLPMLNFRALEEELGMDQATSGSTGFRGTDQGAQIKSTTGWSFNGNGTNSSGFNAVSSGLRLYEDGSYLHEGRRAYFWASDVTSSNTGYYRQLNATFNNDPAGDRKIVSGEMEL